MHPFRAAWETRDVGAWSGAMSPDVVLRSPILTTPFRGRAAVTELYEVLFETLGPVELTDELVDGDTRAFFWRAAVGGRTIDGADLLRTNAHGQVDEIQVMIRPLVDIAAFAAAIGPPLAARRSPLRAAVLRVLTLPLRLLLTVADTLASRLLGYR